MRKLLCLAFVAVLATTAPKGPPTARAANDKVELSATLLLDKAALRQELGTDLQGWYTVVRVWLTPKPGQALAVSADDFKLRSDKDGQRVGPLAPSQIAGKGALVVSTKGGGGMMAENPGPVWGGWPGPPRRLGGESTIVGNAAETSTQATAQTGSAQPEDPVLATLKAKALPEKTATESVTGLLYFLLEGKHKAKNLELQYDGPAGKLFLRFR